tara:strand:- start:63 stop:326 length:264 start_codon:yes stop_codon:yes gene_type:complete
MNFNIEQLKKKIIYRSNYRGTKEMDKLLSSFVKHNIDKFDYQELKDLEMFLNLDDNNIYEFYKGTVKNINFKNQNILDLFKNFKIKN